MAFHNYGWYRWRGKDIVNVGTAHANLAYERGDAQAGLGKLDTLITHAKSTGRGIGFRLRGIPWFPGTVPPSSVIHLYAKGSFEGGTLYLPRYELNDWWLHYEKVLTQAKAKIDASGVPLVFFDIDGLGHGGEAHFFNVTRPDGYVMPTESHRLRMIQLTVRAFGGARCVVPTDNAQMVRDAFAQHPDLGWRRDSLGRAHFKDGAVKKGIWTTLIERSKNPRAITVAEWFGEDPPVDVAMGFAQIKESGIKLVGNGNFGVNADNNSTYLTNNSANFKAISSYLLGLRDGSTATDPTPNPTEPLPTEPKEPEPTPEPAPPPPTQIGGAGSLLRRTLNKLETASTPIAALPAPIRFLWQNERNPRRIWAGVGADLYRSSDGGLTFSKQGTTPNAQPINWIVEAFNQEGTLDVLAGDTAYVTFDGGATLTPALTGPNGSTARNLASGFERHWIGFTGVTAPASPLRSYEGHVAAFPDVTPPVTDIRALTMLVEAPTLYAIDAQGRIWSISAEDGGTCTHVATMPE